MQKVICFMLAALCAASLGCGLGFSPQNRAFTRMQGSLTYNQALKKWGPPNRQYAKDNFLVARWNFNPLVSAGEVCSWDERCIVCDVIWHYYNFYFRAPEMVLDHWSSPFPWITSQAWETVPVPYGSSGEECLKDYSCRRWVEDMCKEKIGPLPEVMPDRPSNPPPVLTPMGRALKSLFN